MTKYLNVKNGIEILHDGGLTQILTGVDDPSIAGQEAAVGSIYLRTSGTASIYTKTGNADTDWVGVVSSADAVVKFLELLDTPSTYDTYNDYFLKVDTTTSGLVFANVFDCGTFI